MQWYVLYTKSRTEIKTAGRLKNLGIEVYCPVITEVRQWSDRKKKVTVPLFKSYVFVRMEAKNRNLVFEVPGVVSYLFWLGERAVVKDEEIKVIRQWLENDGVDEAKIDVLNAGDRITISKGAFKDQEAIIKEVGKKTMRLILPKLNCVLQVKASEVLG
ncbi:UpxY family transcription antiterminator [Gillisia sp. Q332]|uniref:UpxY family transcription antiterminator n=1 Tax=Gillisia xinjiangensis TaxID=3384765 RepID=UPI003918F68D